MLLLKPFIFCVLIFSWQVHPLDLKNILIRSKWKVAVIWTQKNNNKVDLNSPDAKVDSVSTLRGQIVTFYEDYTCHVRNSGTGLWSEIEKYNWSVESNNSLVFRNKGQTFTDGFTLTPFSFNNDSVILYITYKSIESKNSKLVIYQLSKYD
jgi:hypothetical protein